MLLGMPVSLLTTATIWANAVVASRGNIHIPLNHNQGAINATEHAAQVSSRYLGVSGSSGLRKSPTSLNAGFWYGTFGVGDSQNLSLLIDTGSSDVGVDTAKYEPGPASMNLHISGNHSYATAFANGCGEVNVSYHGYADRVSHAGLWVKNQHLYHIAKETPPNKQTLTEIPHDGIVGFAGNTTKYSFLGGLPYLQNLCKESLVEECRFGLAFDTSGTGKEILGGIETDMIEGEMTVVETEGHTQWSGTGTVTAKGSPIFENATVIFDTGTAGIVGPVARVRTLFEHLGIQAVGQDLEGCDPGVFGYYPCDSPPEMGFQFGEGPNFNVDPKAIQLADNGKNNCTVFITGIDFQEDIWVIGQNWFQGKYVDFQQSTGGIGVAPLKSETCT